MKTKTVKISELTPDNINANKGTQRGSAMLEKSLREYGAGRSVLVDKAGRIIAGNKTIEAAGSIGLEDAVLIETDGSQVVIVKRTDLDLDSPQGRGLAIADNRVAEVGLEWDLEALEKIGEELDLGEFWFDDELPEIDFGSIDEDEDDEPTGDADAVPEVEAVPTSKRGDLWILGEHRVLCGDSTNAEDVARLMNGQQADTCLTDPPYGLGDTVSIKNNYDEHVDSVENLKKIISEFIPLARDVATITVITPGNGNTRKYPQPTWTMAWFTPAGAGRGPWGFCCWQPILCYGNDPKLANGMGCHPDAIVHTESSEKNGHPCPKPINFWVWLMNRVVVPNGLVFEPFTGSGTGIIAAEQTQRKCYGMEISPQYVDVIVKRWQDYTGKEAAHEDGRTFAQVAEERASNEAQETED